MLSNGELGLVTDDSFFLMVAGDLVAIVHVIALEAHRVYFQLRGLEYVQRTFCHGGELAVLQQTVAEHAPIGNPGHAFAFAFSMFDLRIAEWGADMVSLTRLPFADAVLSGLGRTAPAWELRALIFGVLAHVAANGALPPDGAHLDGVVPQFSVAHLALVRGFATRLDVVDDDPLLRRLWNIIHFIRGAIVGGSGELCPERMLELFDGRADLGELAREEDAVLSSFRFSVAALMCASVGFAPDGDDEEELFGFLKETYDTYRAMPIRSPHVTRDAGSGSRGVVSMVAEQDAVSIVRFAKSKIEWTFFSLESECIRGYWSNEARSILFLAMSSRERNSIQMNVHSLRNITNQSCNPPIGYPALVTDVLESYIDMD
jgi:hypothetical protein